MAVVLLLASLYPLQFLLDALRAANLLRLSIGALFLACAAGAVLVLARRRVALRTWLVLALSGAFYAALALVMEVPQERLHLVEYGALALLVRAAFAESLAVRGPGRRMTRAGVWARHEVDRKPSSLLINLPARTLPPPANCPPAACGRCAPLRTSAGNRAP